MRHNLPVSGTEFDFPASATLMSTTDVASRITYANDAFIDVSGYSLDEIQGQPHNLVRHPDMPAQAFADMWATLKAGESWTGLVKNRRKNGDFYWVRANATPVVRNGQTVGYMSVRTKPGREEIDAASRLYADVREGRAGKHRFHKGLVLRGGAWAWLSLLKTVSVRWRVRAALLSLLPSILVGAFALGIPGSTLGALAIVIAAAVSAVAMCLEAQITRPLESLCAQAQRVACGEVRNDTPMDRVDEIGRIQRSIGQIGLMFRWVIDDVSGQVRKLQSATSEIASGTLDLSARTEQAAASVEQTASSMEEMTAAVKNSAETAGQANSLSASASDAAERGGEAVAQVVQTMAEIDRSARRIADITGVIDSIAFQTNILALNAAVEAARAGEEGRGFAVVAGEVRSLAQRSAEAAREIKTLIGASVERVASGARLVDDAGRTMGDIVGQVKRVSSMIAEISTSTAEQSDGIAQVNQAVGHLDQITQQNAALVEQSSAASDSLKRQAGRLVEAVGVFR